MKRLAFLLIPAAALCAEPGIRGFSPQAAAEERRLEDRAHAVPQAARVREYIQRMSAEPHDAGTPASRAVADYAVGLMKSWGLDARIEEFEALIPRPQLRVVEMLSPVPYRASLTEPSTPRPPAVHGFGRATNRERSPPWRCGTSKIAPRTASNLGRMSDARLAN